MNKHIVKHIVKHLALLSCIAEIQLDRLRVYCQCRGTCCGSCGANVSFLVPCSRPSLMLINEDKVSKSDTLPSCRVAGGQLDGLCVYCQCRDSVKPNCRIVCNKRIVKHPIKHTVQRK